MGEFKNYPETHLSPPTVIDLFSATFLFPPYMIRFRTQFLVKTAFQFLKIIVSNPVVKHLIHHLTHFWSISCIVTGIDLALTHFREIQSFQQKAVTHSQCHLGLSLNHLSGVSQLILLRLKVIYNYSLLSWICLPYLLLSHASFLFRLLQGTIILWEALIL